MSHGMCGRCGVFHRVGPCPERAQRPPANRTADEVGQAARALIDAANAAAVARAKHAATIPHASSIPAGEMMHVAASRRQRDAEAFAALESYIETIVKLQTSRKLSDS